MRIHVQLPKLNPITISCGAMPHMVFEIGKYTNNSVPYTA